jgi:hypothetical protein
MHLEDRLGVILAPFGQPVVVIGHLDDWRNEHRNKDMQVAAPISGRILGFKVLIQSLVEIN